MRIPSKEQNIYVGNRQVTGLQRRHRGGHNTSRIGYFSNYKYEDLAVYNQIQFKTALHARIEKQLQ